MCVDTDIINTLTTETEDEIKQTMDNQYNHDSPFYSDIYWLW